MSVHALDQAGAQTFTNPPKAKKLRLSCDGCLGAKVKCTKERPSCGRCISQDTPCVYSESRRAGRRGIKSEGRKEDRADARKLNLGDSPLSGRPTSRRTTWEDDMWHLDPPNTEQGHFPQAPVGHFDSQAGSADSIDFMFSSPTTCNQNGTMDMSNSIGSGLLNWIPDIDSNTYQGSYPPDNISPNTATNPMLHSGFTPDAGTLSDSSVASDPGSMPCNCQAALQEKFNALNLSVLPFDEFITKTKSAVTCMTHSLSCNCLPDISSVMLLSFIITRLVQWHKQISSGDCQASKDVGMTMGTVKFDSEDEYQIKQMLVRSELIKIRSLIDRFHGRFENFLLGTERQVYEANVEYLEMELDRTIEDL